MDLAAKIDLSGKNGVLCIIAVLFGLMLVINWMKSRKR